MADDEENSETLTRPVPEVVVISRQVFNQYLQKQSFSSWEDFVEALESAPQGASHTVVKCDPMDICTWVASFLIQCCIWGMVGYFSDQSIVAGVLLSASYGILLWLCVDLWLPSHMAGMLWPNLPVTIAVLGALCAILFQANPAKPACALFCSILPATAATLYWMKKLPEDPDRATLVVNLFFCTWVTLRTLKAMAADEDLDFFLVKLPPGYFDSTSLVALGFLSVALALHLFHSHGPFSSVELITWTLNVGTLAVGAGTAGTLITFSLEHQDFELLGWCVYCLVHGLLGFLGIYLERSLPVLLSALALEAVSVRGAMAVGELTGSAVAGICTFGVLGFLMIALLWSLRPKVSEGRQVYR